MAAIQEISARIGCVTGHGIATNLRRHYPRWLLDAVVLALLAANTFNLAADIGAMGDVIKLLIGGPALLWAPIVAAVSLILEVYLSYARYAALLKWLTLSLFAYVATVFAVKLPWGEALRGVFLPSLTLDGDHLTAMVAVLGTTISPYLFFWQSSQEVEERVRRHAKPLCIAPRQAGPDLRRIRLDTLVGMGFSNLIALFIILASAATLHAAGHTDIQSSAQAAEALRPIAGPFAATIFAIGIIGTGLLGLPVLAGSAAYAVCETFRWNEGLGRRPHQAKAFYATMLLATLLGVLIDFLPIDPVKALYWSAVLNGVLAAPLMAVMMLMAANRQVMGRLTLPRGLKLWGWAATLVMAAASLAFLIG
jgi:Mn2+/Fe2+ NRAMP family transporter